MKINDKANLLKVDQRVTTAFNLGEEEIIRKITTIFKDKNCGSGYRASADGGGICNSCGRTSSSIKNVDAGWFIPV